MAKKLIITVALLIILAIAAVLVWKYIRGEEVLRLPGKVIPTSGLQGDTIGE